MAKLELAPYREALRELPLGSRTGRLTQSIGLSIECEGLAPALGELCRIEGLDGGVLAEVVGFESGVTRLMPLGEARGLRSGARVTPMGHGLRVPVGEHLLGRIVDGLCRPLDGRELPASGELAPLERPAPGPLERRPIDRRMTTGISVMDAGLTMGQGQRIGIFAGSGVGKSTLLADIAREATADVNVIALIGERGREVRDFIERALGPQGLARSVVVVATSDAPPLIRIKASLTAVAIAEGFRDRGRDCLLMMDSVTRLAGAVREVGLSIGEPPTVKGYPPSFFSLMPRIVERLGATARGSITGILTVLVEGGNMDTDPVGDTMRGLLDGHVVLSRKLAQRGHFPAVDPLASVSRLMDDLVTPEHMQAWNRLREDLAAYEEARDLIGVGAYQGGSDPKVDRAIRSIDAIEAFLRQGRAEPRSFEQTQAALLQIASESP